MYGTKAKSKNEEKSKAGGVFLLGASDIRMIRFVLYITAHIKITKKIKNLTFS